MTASAVFFETRPTPPEGSPASPTWGWSEKALRARYTKKISRLVNVVLGADSEREDIVHEILLMVFSSVGSLRDPVCLDRWVTQVALNTIRGTLRRRSVRRCATLDTDLEIPARPSDFEARELASRAMELIERLPANERSLLECHWFSRLSVEELATGSGCSPATVRRRLRRARARFDRLARLDPGLRKRMDD